MSEEYIFDCSYDVVLISWMGCKFRKILRMIVYLRWIFFHISEIFYPEFRAVRVKSQIFEKDKKNNVIKNQLFIKKISIQKNFFVFLKKCPQ